MQKETRAKLQFWGAAGTVTGSKTLIRYNKLKAKVEHLNALSAHGDQTDLLDWVGQFENRPKKIFLNHGEPMASHCLALKLKDTLNLDAEETKMGLTYRL